MKFVKETFKLSEDDNSVYAVKTGSLGRMDIEGATEPVDLNMEVVSAQVVRVSMPTRGPRAGDVRIGSYRLSGRFVKSSSPKNEDEFLRFFKDCFFATHSEDASGHQAEMETANWISKDPSGIITGIRVPSGYLGWYRYSEAVKAE